MLCKLAERNHVRVTGNEHTGSFSSGDVEGDTNSAKMACTANSSVTG